MALLKEWQKLCASFSLIKSENTHKEIDMMGVDDDDNVDDDEGADDDENDDEVFEVEEVIGICYGDPKESKKPGLYFKVLYP